jgi:hypothetical protein
VWEIVDDAARYGFKIALLDNSDAAGALGYHELDDRDGTPYARVFVDDVLTSGGTWLRGASSVAATASHEACELVGDPTANHWAQTARGALVAVELCDPVEDRSYTVTLRDGRRVAVSNFVYPAWFNPFVRAGARIDHMGVLERPFQISEGGYVIRHTPSGGVRNVWGRRYPRWRKAGKRRQGSRTRARHLLG